MTIQEFIAALNARFANYTFTTEHGTKYTKVVQSSNGQTSGSAYCFIDTEGNVYKPANWKTPAKGIRARLATVDITRIDPYGGWLYR